VDLAGGIRTTPALFVDAPVSGSVPAVDAGTLLVMAGGERDAVQAATTVLTAFARKVLHVGAAGAGQAVKLAVNLIVHDLNAAIAEALALAVDAGIPAAATYDVLQESVVAAPFVVYKRAAFLDADAPVAMSLDLVDKDLRLIRELAAEYGTSIPVTEAVAQSVTDARRAGFGRSDMAALLRFLRTRTDRTPAA
jgi:3-hydroxyisobutyrate dehydrogenase-like beta-hydroxyacid dehydrogenase